MGRPEEGIPPELQPDPREWGFDVERALQAVAALRSVVPEDAFTAGTLGTERAGSAVHVRDGLLLTVGYLITEASEVWLRFSGGSVVPGHALAFDHNTGFGLVQALGRVPAPVLELGDSRQVRPGEPVIVAAAGGLPAAISAKVGGRQEFAGYWEYLIEDALFTLPAHPFWGGAAVIGAGGNLVGIGSLVLQQGGEAHRIDMNMAIPTQALLPILDDLLRYGRVNRPARPWLGLYAMEDDDALLVGGLAEGGPADQAGVRTGDRILAVNETEVPDLAGLWRAVWAAGNAGSTVTLTLGRGTRAVQVPVQSGDRMRFLKAPRMH
jgi:S1-C subfamily serine protease